MTLSIEQFCDQHYVCNEGREWALSNCRDMEEVWRTAKPEWLLWIASRQGVLTDKELRMFVVFCARQVQHLMEDQRSIKAIDVAERYANGFATNEELTAARAAARSAVRDADAVAYAAWAAARPAVKNVVYAAFAARDAAWIAAAAVWDAAMDADAAGYAAWATTDADRAAEAAGYAAWAADAGIKERQAAWLRENCKPKLFE